MHQGTVSSEIMREIFLFPFSFSIFAKILTECKQGKGVRLFYYSGSVPYPSVPRVAHSSVGISDLL